MIIDTLTKFNYRRKMWMTPEHSLCLRNKEFKVMYGALIILQAKRNKDISPLNNFELERLLKEGLKLDSSDIAWAMRNARDEKEVIRYLMVHLGEKEKALLLMDMMNVSIIDGEIQEKEKETIWLAAHTLEVSEDNVRLFYQFIHNALAENINECQLLAEEISSIIKDMAISDLKYYIMQLSDTSEFTQKMMEEKKNVRLIDRCNIYEDIVLERGMSLTIDHAVIRIFGNIALNGGTLKIKNSKIIRKSGSHRACINLHTSYSVAEISSVEADCRNFGMFIRAEAGKVRVKNSHIYNTTRGAAIRFWGEEIVVADSNFSYCYSPEDGGAIMVRGGEAYIKGCHFTDCEAKRGGAVYGIEGTQIKDCEFLRCNVAEYGAAVYYYGNAQDSVDGLVYEACHPSGAEFVQNISSGKVLSINREYHINNSVIIDCPVIVEKGGKIVIENANVYLNFPLRCQGSLIMKNVRVICNHLEDSDMIYLESAKECDIYHCEFDGMLKVGGINIKATKVTIRKSLFRNTSGGRAIFNAYQPKISECIFNFCQKGAIYSQGGEIEKCVFVNCRAKAGAGVQMYGTKGLIEKCNFKRCVSEFSGGAIDKSIAQKVVRCLFEECKPDNVN